MKAKVAGSIGKGTGQNQKDGRKETFQAKHGLAIWVSLLSLKLSQPHVPSINTA